MLDPDLEGLTDESRIFQAFGRFGRGPSFPLFSLILYAFHGRLLIAITWQIIVQKDHQAQGTIF